MVRRIPGEFVPADVNLANDPAIMRAGPLAELMFRRANEYAKRNDRDGVICGVELGVIAFGIPGRPIAHAEALVREGLWEQSGDDYVIRSFLKWNMSQVEQAEDKEKKRLAAILTNHKRYHHKEPQADCPHCMEVAE
jgi:hypothetical protein